MCKCAKALHYDPRGIRTPLHIRTCWISHRLSYIKGLDDYEYRDLKVGTIPALIQGSLMIVLKVLHLKSR